MAINLQLLTAFTVHPVQKQPRERYSHHDHVHADTSLNAIFTAIETASASVVGSDPDSPGKVNQDASFHFQSSRFICGGVLDGHGKKGHILNEFLVSYIPKALKSRLLCENDDAISIENILIETFENAHYAARMDESVPAGRSGTTCVVTVVDTKVGVIYTGIVGDSRAIIAIKDDHSDWRVTPLSNETTTSRECERSRIEQHEGRIDSGGNVWYGPVGIAMTRALGDSVMKRAGVIPTPEVTCFDLNDELDELNANFLLTILMGSDGIFDVMSNEVANAFFQDTIDNGSSLEDGCSQLVEEARRKWQGGLPVEVRIDDATIAALTFNYITAF